VKREDLCGVEGSPTFSKIRGIVEHLKELKKEGIFIIGYTETSISMAGWGVAWACKMLGMKAVIFDPQYKQTPEVLQYHRDRWKEHNAVIIPIKAGMAKVNWYVSKNKLAERYGIKKAVLLPLGLPFQQTIQATAKEVIKTVENLPKIDNVVVNIGSGTICAGIWKGLSKIDYICELHGVLGRTSELIRKRSIIANKAGIIEDGLFCNTNVELLLFDPGWQYTQKSEVSCPFPSHPYYDLKAWEWLINNLDRLPGTILFWNIGH
jgi:threonine dehydratase